NATFTPDSLNLIEFYGCSPAKAQVLKDAVVKLARAAAYLRDALDGHSDKAHAASMLDAGFNGAFSKSFNKNDNIRIVRRTFDLMSRGLALNPCDEEQTARVQFACVDKTESGDVSTKGSADPRLALVSAFEEWWHARFDYENTLACASTLGKPFSRDLGHAANAAHEMAHLAGALGFPEAYHRYNMLRLTPEQAIYNAQHYARAILSRLQDCDWATLDNIAFLLAGLTAGGGITGYVRTGSVPSIAAGVTVGALYALGGQRIRTRQPYGSEIALLASVVLAGSSIPRAIKTAKPLPIGLSGLAAVGLWAFGSEVARARG
ncbi:MAG: hypothetical protein M1831_000812, partial [Alyxoria varia]